MSAPIPMRNSDRPRGERPPNRRTMQDAILAELLDAVRAMQGRFTDAMVQWRSNITNRTLAVGLYQLGTDGIATESYPSPYGSLMVVNTSAHVVTVTSSPPSSGSAPTIGKGVATVRAGTSRVVNMAGTAWTLYGTASDIIGVEVFTGPQAAHTGTC